jgi:hypothetical protein
MHPQLKMLGAFKELYTNDHTRDKEATSRVMWAITYLVDPSQDNNFRNIQEDEKRALLAKDFLKQPNFDWNKYTEVIEFFKDCTLTQAEKSLVVWQEIMALRDRELKLYYKDAFDTKDISVIKELDTLLKNTAGYYTDYMKIKKEFDTESDIKRGKGTKILSATDAGEI